MSPDFKKKNIMRKEKKYENTLYCHNAIILRSDVFQIIFFSSELY